MLLLDAVNTVLRSVGESRVATLNSNHPQIATILDFITAASEVLQSRPWWFNTFQRDFAADGAGEYPVSSDVTYFQPYSLGMNVTLLKGYICDAKSGERWVSTLPASDIRAFVRVQINAETSYEDFPQSFAHYLAAVAALEYAADYDADSGQLQKLATRVKATKTMVEADNIRLSRVNLFETGTVGHALARNFGSRYWRYL